LHASFLSHSFFPLLVKDFYQGFFPQRDEVRVYSSSCKRLPRETSRDCLFAGYGRLALPICFLCSCYAFSGRRKVFFTFEDYTHIGPCSSGECRSEVFSISKTSEILIRNRASRRFDPSRKFRAPWSPDSLSRPLLFPSE